VKRMRGVSALGGSVTDLLLDAVRSNKAGEPVGIYSICSANRHVLEAGMLQAKADDTVACIESTSNQVNQFGGYIGMTPAQFAQFVRDVAAGIGLPPERVILGGDHLGPHVWQKEPAASAMTKACALVEGCVRAGYVKIHLDTSMRCAGDPGGSVLPDEIVTERAAELCAAAEAAHGALPDGAPLPLYIIGTEVPKPGGEQIAGEPPSVTRTEDVGRTIELARGAFHKRGLHSAWDRTIGIVVQPGVEFGDSTIFDYDRAKAYGLSKYIEKNWHVVFEAHSTDYQKPEGLKQMVEDHFAILKVGPWLTFAFREAVFALAEIEREWLGPDGPLSRVRETLESVMVQDPAHWRSYYAGDDAALAFARKYSYSDRSRYYWPRAEVQDALCLLLKNLAANPAPLTLLSQFMPAQYAAVRQGAIRNQPEDLIRHRVLEVMDIYARAVSMR
jgi:D-tagatose-1,6-bisphosphate aldolase subunit GatZ/KbaZ